MSTRPPRYLIITVASCYVAATVPSPQLELIRSMMVPVDRAPPCRGDRARLWSVRSSSYRAVVISRLPGGHRMPQIARR